MSHSFQVGNNAFWDDLQDVLLQLIFMFPPPPKKQKTLDYCCHPLHTWTLVGWTIQQLLLLALGYGRFWCPN